jgi:SAM-dependent methyltransferase
MSTKQFDIYAKFYDLLYKDKNYPEEAAYMDQLIKKHSPVNQSQLTLLDLACGTGKHLFELSSLGYKNLSGSDISSAMIEKAKEKAGAIPNDIPFYNYSFQQSHLIKKQFDIVISMFSAVNYLTNFGDQTKTFKNVNGLLKENGLFIFDYWNGNAVIRDYSPVKVLRKKDGNAEIMRISTTNVNTVTQGVSVKFNCLYIDKGHIIDEFEEIHNLHYYHFSEMYNLLEIAGFEILHLSPFLRPEKETGPYDWNISIVAKKRKP